MPEIPAGARYTVEPLRPRPRRPRPRRVEQRRRSDDGLFWWLLLGWLFGSSGS